MIQQVYKQLHYKHGKALPLHHTSCKYKYASLVRLRVKESSVVTLVVYLYCCCTLRKTENKYICKFRRMHHRHENTAVEQVIEVFNGLARVLFT